MPAIRAVFWDVGGVLLTNGWDQDARTSAAQTFGLDAGDFEALHGRAVEDFETGRLSLDDYLQQVVFSEPRRFTVAAFRDFMLERSQAHEELLQLARSISDSGRYLTGILNNESRELNDFRIHRFGLRGLFDVFVSSCFVGMRKPEPAIYRLAIDVTQKEAAEIVLIDDRKENVDAALRAGMRAVWHDSGRADLERKLGELGIRW